jgi:hypothetical protein
MLTLILKPLCRKGETEMEKPRPTGVTVLAILEALIGLVMVFEGSGLALLGALAGMFTEGLADFLGALSGILGVVMIVIGVLSFFTAFGVWNGRSWAWTLSVVLTILGLLFGLIFLFGSLILQIVWIVVYAVIIYYLYRPNVKFFFGKSSS